MTTVLDVPCLSAVPWVPVSGFLPRRFLESRRGQSLRVLGGDRVDRADVAVGDVAGVVRGLRGGPDAPRRLEAGVLKQAEGLAGEGQLSEGLLHWRSPWRREA